MNQLSFTPPALLRAGDSIKWLIEHAGYPASGGWSLIYMLRNAEEEIDLTSEADGDGHLIRLKPAQTADWTGGEYTYRAQFVKGDDEAITVAEGKLRIAPSYADGAVDDRSTAQIALDNVMKRLNGSGLSAVMEYEIAGRRIRYYTITELLALETRLRREVEREKLAQGKSTGLSGRIHVRFGP